MSKNLDLARDLLLWSSSIAYIFTAFSGCPTGNTLTRHILEQDFVERPWQTSVQRELTSCVVGFSPASSPPCCNGGLRILGVHEGGPGCRAELWLSLLHSSHFRMTLQSRAKCDDEEQHLKQIPWSFRYAFRSSMVFNLKHRHFLKGWGLLCIGQYLAGSPLEGILSWNALWEISVLCTNTGVLKLERFTVSPSYCGRQLLEKARWDHYVF